MMNAFGLLRVRTFVVIRLTILLVLFGALAMISVSCTPVVPEPTQPEGFPVEAEATPSEETAVEDEGEGEIEDEGEAIPVEIVPLQSVDDYEREEAILAVQAVDTSDDPLLQSLVELAMSELTGAEPLLPEDSVILQEPALVIAEGAMLAPTASLLMALPPIGEECLILPESSYILSSGLVETPESYLLLPENSYVLPESCLGFPVSSLEVPIDTPLPEGIVVLPAGSVVVPERSVDLPPVIVPRGDIASPSENQGSGGTYTDHIVTQLFTARWPAVGALLVEEDGYYKTACTVTLIGCDTALTAHHCFKNNPPPERLKVFFQSGGIIDVAAIHPHPDYSQPNADVAILRLAEAVDGIRPETFNAVNGVGANVTGKIVGFGRSGGGDVRDFGLKRYGEITTSACGAGLSDENLICWNFVARSASSSASGSSCNGDSGGPFYYPGDSQISGVISGATSKMCDVGEHAYTARVSRYQEWIATNSGSLGGDRCGTLPSVNIGMMQVAGGVFTETGKYKLHQISVPSGTQLLRITMNGEDPGPGEKNFNLYLKAGEKPAAEEPNPGDFDCSSRNIWQYEVCEIANPTPGDWYVLVHRVINTTGPGHYQIVATTFPTE